MIKIFSWLGEIAFFFLLFALVVILVFVCTVVIIRTNFCHVTKFMIRLVT